MRIPGNTSRADADSAQAPGHDAARAASTTRRPLAHIADLRPPLAGLPRRRAPDPRMDSSRYESAAEDSPHGSTPVLDGRPAPSGSPSPAAHDSPPRIPLVDLPLLLTPERAAPSDSARWRQPQAAATGQAIVIDIPEPVTPSPHDEARTRLEQLAFPDGLSAGELAVQQAMEERYVDWLATDVIAARRRTYGTTRYTFGASTPALGREAFLPAAYEFVRQFLSSSSRSPVRNALTTAMAPKFVATTTSGVSRAAPGELFNNTYDPAVIGGAVGGMTAYQSNVVLTALDRRAKLANLPALKPVDPKALVPDPPPVLLQIVDGRKRYAPPGSAGLPTRADLAEDVHVKRANLARWQAVLSGKAEALIFQPAMSGIANATRRRTAQSIAEFNVPIRVFLGSVWASGTGGGLARATLELLRGTPWLSQASVADAVGGQQRLNLFTARRRDPDAPPPGLRDLKGLPRFGADVVREAAQMFAHSIDVRNRSWQDLGLQAMDVARHTFSNIFASVASPGVGALLGQVLRAPYSGPKPDEPLTSAAYTLQQFGQSGTNDLFWNVMLQASKDSAYDLGASLDRRRARVAARLQVEIDSATAGLAEVARERAPTADQAGWPSAVATLLNHLGAAAGTPDDRVAALRGAHDALAQWRPDEADGAQRRSEMLRAVAAVLEPSTRHAALLAWQNGTGPNR